MKVNYALKAAVLPAARLRPGGLRHLRQHLAAWGGVTFGGLAGC